MEYIKYEDFKKLDIRVGTVLEVEEIKEADKLLCFQIDFGEKEENGEVKKRQIVSGIKEFYPNFNELIGKQLLYILNLEPRKIKGVESNGMLLALGEENEKPIFIIPENNTKPGSKVK